MKPGSDDRIELYRQRAADEESLFAGTARADVGWWLAEPNEQDIPLLQRQSGNYTRGEERNGKRKK